MMALDWGKADFIKGRQDLAKVDWQQLLAEKSTAEPWGYIQKGNGESTGPTCFPSGEM